MCDRIATGIALLSCLSVREQVCSSVQSLYSVVSLHCHASNLRGGTQFLGHLKASKDQRRVSECFLDRDLSSHSDGALPLVRCAHEDSSHELVYRHDWSPRQIRTSSRTGKDHEVDSESTPRPPICHHHPLARRLVIHTPDGLPNDRRHRQDPELLKALLRRQVD